MKIRLLILVLWLAAASLLQAYTFGQNKLNLEPETWSQIATMHFDIYFPRGEGDFGKLAALMAEETYYRLRDDLSFPLGSRVPIIIYRNKTGFQNTNIIYPLLTEGIGGFTESLHNRVVIPFDGSYKGLEELLAHELTHAYANSLESGLTNALTSLSLSSLPLWFSEGLPEYLSVGGKSDYNNMFVMDMVVNDKLPSLENAGGYYAYRLGESFLDYIARTWGRDKVSEYFFALRSVKNLDSATKKVFGMKFADLESRWRFQLKRDFLPQLGANGVPAEDMERRTDSEKDGSYLNFMPRFSPNGERYVYFSSAGARYSIWLAGAHGLSAPRKIMTGEATGKVEEFYYFRSSLSWFPDNRRVAFAAKTAHGDRIHILDTDKGKITETLDLKGFDAIYELDVAPDGESIVFAGQRNMQCDLFGYDLKTADVKQLTNDLYNDLQPRFSPDGMSVFFASERDTTENSGQKGFFAGLVNQIYQLDLQSGEIRQQTFEPKDCSFPLPDQTGNKLLFINSGAGVSNLFVLDLSSREKAQLTNVLSGVYSADLSADSRHLLLSNYFNGAWNIYYSTGLGDSLSFAAYPEASLWDGKKSLMDQVDLGKLDYFGKREKPRPKRENPASGYARRDPFLSDFPAFEFTREDSLRLNRDFSYDERPTKIETIPQVKDYRTKFSLDNLWGGLAYSPSVGTIGYVELSMSDLMGNHGIGLQAEISGKIEDSSILLTYLFLKRRTDLGLGVFNLFDEVIYKTGVEEYIRYRERQSGLYFLLRYPLSRFFRVEFDNLLYQRGQYVSDWIWDSPTSNTGHWGGEDKIGQAVVCTPGLTLVHDNALYGSTGPLLGWRAFYNASTTLSDSKFEYLTNYLDWRSYTLFSKRYSLALRTIAGISVGDHPQHFELGGYYGVRAYEGDLSGEKKAVANLELRFPFLEYLNLAFPLPLSISNVRGSLFADLGTVFDDFKDFRGMQDGTLKDLYLGYGFGPRVDLGIMLLRFDVTWLTDLSHHSKPTYYLSLSEDF
ncbi:MAG TPA: BamA/TamA family outer membrane protein [Candidatus Syntrophosphaera sp.]|jgi:hypothetical protein|nr:BamA/TamA family outer membrane protein [Candidatus Syntrophosphaera sp.]